MAMIGEAPSEDDTKNNLSFSGGSGAWMRNMSKHAGIPWEQVSLGNTICCAPPCGIFPTDPKAQSYISREDGQRAVTHCAEAHLWPAIKRTQTKKLFAVGGQALEALTGKRGINTWRGSPLPLRQDSGLSSGKPQLIPIIHPAALMRQAKLVSVTVGDLRKGLQVPPENYNLFPSLQDVQRFRSRTFAYDLEWDKNGITVCGLSDRFYGAIVVPWIDPYISELRRIFESADSIIGHNIINADNPWLERLGWSLPKDKIQDTMLKQHLCQPDYPHDLAFVASVFTGKVFWKGKGWEEVDEDSFGEAQPGQQWRTWDRGDALPRALGGYGGCLSVQEAFNLYNARDTDAEFQINTPLDAMLRKWSLESIYLNVSRPAAYICREISDRGLAMDTSRLGSLRTSIDSKILGLESRLPEGLAPYEREVSCNLPAPEGTYRPKTKVCKGSKGLRHGSVGIVFEFPSDKPCNTCGRVISSGKMSPAKIIKGTKIRRIVPYNSPPLVQEYVSSLRLQEVVDRKTGNRTTGKVARGIWAKDHPEFTLLGSLKEQVTLRNNFAKDSLIGLDRMYFNLKVHGTNEGRLSCSGKRRGIDLNIQNQPAEFRGIYIPDDPSFGFLNGDISQGESWLTCWLAEDWARWEKLQSKGYDEHSELASAQFGKVITKAHTNPNYWQKEHPDWTVEQCVAEALAWDVLRQVGKKTNHASSYGMGYKTYHQQLIQAGFTEYRESDAKYFLEEWKRLNPGTVAWQQRTIEMCNRQGYLRNPFGRVRWFSSRDAGTQCLAFLPASCLADMMLRILIAHYPSQFQRELDAEQVSVYMDLVDDWYVSAQVHDSLVLQGPWDRIDAQQERSHMIFTQKWQALNGFEFRADWKRSQESWGNCH